MLYKKNQQFAFYISIGNNFLRQCTSLRVRASGQSVPQMQENYKNCTMEIERFRLRKSNGRLSYMQTYSMTLRIS